MQEAGYEGEKRVPGMEGCLERLRQEDFETMTMLYKSVRPVSK